MLCHPTEIRPLSVREYTRLQQFPDAWEFAGGVPQQYIQAGNAVPPGLGKAIGLAVRKAMRRPVKPDLIGKVICEDADLLERLVNRPRTILNPTRMRKHRSVEAAKRWLSTNGRHRQGLLNLIDNQDDQQNRKAADRNGKPGHRS